MRGAKDVEERPAAATAATAEAEGGGREPGVALVEAMAAHGKRDPAAAAAVLQAHPGAQHAIMAAMHRLLGNGFVQAALGAMGKGGSTMTVHAGGGLHVRSTPDRTSDANVIGALPHGAAVETRGTSGEWATIDHAGNPAYVFAQFLAPVHAAATPAHAAPVAAPATPVAAPATPVAAEPAHVAPITAPVAAAPAHAVAPVAAAPTVAALAPAPTPVVAAPVAKADATPDPTIATAFVPKVHAPAPAKTDVTVAEPTADDAAHRVRGQSYDGRSLDSTAYMANYHTLEGGVAVDTIKTTDDEGTTLAAMRGNDRKLDPVYLQKLQDRLGVKNATGAMNTETLRAIRAHYKDSPVHVTATSILDPKGTVLTAILGGTPVVELGDGFHSRSHGDTGRVSSRDKPDALARVCGYGSYEDMLGDMHQMKLLDQSIGVGLPYLKSRVELADKFLRQRHPLDATHPTWHDVATKKLGWNPSAGVGAYGNTRGEVEQYGIVGGHAVGAHLHSAGLALDIDTKQNPYVFQGSANDANNIMEKHLRWAAQLYGGEAMKPDVMNESWSKLSTDELFAKVDTVSHSLAKYLELGNTKSDVEIADAFVRLGGFTLDQARGNVPAVKHFAKKGFKDSFYKENERYWDHSGREEAKGLENQGLDLLVALRDAAGLSWGGNEMSSSENGDFMHWDVRNSGIGKAVHAFAMANREAPVAPVAAAGRGPDHDPQGHH